MMPHDYSSRPGNPPSRASRTVPEPAYCSRCEEVVHPEAVYAPDGHAWCPQCGATLPWIGPDLELVDGAEEWPPLQGNEATPVPGGGVDERGRPLVPFGPDAQPLPPFDPDRPDQVRRRARLEAWAAKHGLQIPSWARDVLACCDSASEVRFVWTIVQDSRWRQAGDRGFTDGHYTLQLQVPVGPYRADAILTGPELTHITRGGTRVRGVAFEIDGPQHGEARRDGREHARDVALADAGFAPYHIASDHAESEGDRIRRAILRDRLARHTAAAPSAAPAEAAADPRWMPNDVSYNVAGLKHDERCRLAASWLAHRWLRLPDEWTTLTRQAFLDAVAHCERGGELILCHAYLTRPGWRRMADTPEGCPVFGDGEATLTIRPEIAGHRVTAIWRYVDTASNESYSSAIIVDLPNYVALTPDADRARDRAIKRAGHHLIVLPAARIRDLTAHIRAAAGARAAIPATRGGALPK